MVKIYPEHRASGSTFSFDPLVLVRLGDITRRRVLPKARSAVGAPSDVERVEVLDTLLHYLLSEDKDKGSNAIQILLSAVMAQLASCIK